MVYDATIVGGGFYGSYLATFLKHKYKEVIILEREPDILMRASYTNQARVHNGYHYPRNYITALRSAINFPRFVADFYPAIDHSFEKIYAVARHNSKVTSEQFVSFCKKIHVPIEVLSDHDRKLFDVGLIESVFKVKEFAFNAATIRSILKRRIDDLGVELGLAVHVEKLVNTKQGSIIVMTSRGVYESKAVYICGYSGINTLLTNSKFPSLPMKHEITEMALVRVPDVVEDKAITVMDGPFFSIMPFPDRKMHILSHVRYTPHKYWSDTTTTSDPYKILEDYRKTSRYQYMIRDAERYIPVLANIEYVESLYEIKTVLAKNEENDGRPILFQKDHGIPGVAVVMGGKIDNIYDIISAMHTLRQC